MGIVVIVLSEWAPVSLSSYCFKYKKHFWLYSWFWYQYITEGFGFTSTIIEWSQRNFLSNQPCCFIPSTNQIDIIPRHQRPNFVREIQFRHNLAVIQRLYKDGISWWLRIFDSALGCSIFISSPRFVHQLLCVRTPRRRNNSKCRVLEEPAFKHPEYDNVYLSRMSIGRNWIWRNLGTNLSIINEGRISSN